jgi:hypothetical protein
MSMHTYKQLLCILKGTTCDHGNPFVKLVVGTSNTIMTSRYGNSRRRTFCSCKQIFFGNISSMNNDARWYDSTNAESAALAARQAFRYAVTAGYIAAKAEENLIAITAIAATACDEVMRKVAAATALSPKDTDAIENVSMAFNVYSRKASNAFEWYDKTSSDIKNACGVDLDEIAASDEIESPALSGSDNLAFFASVRCHELPNVAAVVMKYRMIAGRISLCRKRCVAHLETFNVVMLELQKIIYGGPTPGPHKEANTAVDLEESVKEVDEEMDALCPICWLFPGKVTTACAHIFCEQCLDKWLLRNKTCPMCRQDI